MKIKTIDLDFKEWFDKINGNSYFSGEININYGLKNSKTILMPFQYGYGDHYIYMSFKKIKEEFNINFEGNYLYKYCRENNILLRYNKVENCLKKELL